MLRSACHLPAEEEAGSTITVDWVGPNYKGEYICIGQVGATNSAALQAYGYTDAGNPAIIMLPEEPVDYVVTYFIGLDRSVAGQVPLTVDKERAARSGRLLIPSRGAIITCG